MNSENELQNQMCEDLSKMQEQIEIVSQNLVHLMYLKICNERCQYQNYMENGNESIQNEEELQEKLEESTQIMLDNLYQLECKSNEVKIKMGKQQNRIVMPPDNNAFQQYFRNQSKIVIKEQVKIDKIVQKVNENAELFGVQMIKSKKYSEFYSSPQLTSQEQMQIEDDNDEMME